MAEDFTKETSRDIASAQLKKFSDEVFSKRMLGFSFSRAWVFLVFFNETALLAPSGERAEVLGAVYQGSLLVLVLTMFACGLLHRRCEALFRSKAARVMPAAFCIVGTAAIPFASLGSTGGAAMLVVAAAATGFGSGLLLLLWGKIYAAEGGPSTAAEVSVSYVIAALLVPFYHLMDAAAQLVIVSILPVASTALMAGELACIADESADEEDAPAAAGTGGTSGYASILAKFAISSVVFGSVISVVRFFYTAGAPMEPMPLPGFVFPLSAVLVGVVMLAILLLSKRLDLAFSYRPVLIFMALGCLLLPFFETNHFFSYVFALSGYFCFEIVGWVMMSDMSFRFDVPPFRAYGFGRCAVSGGVLLGVVATTQLAGVELTSQVRLAAACFMLFLMVVAYTLTLTERDIARVHKRSMDRYRAENGADAEPEPAREPLTLEDMVEMVAEENQVSGRALEVMLLLAQGRTAARIEQELYISRGTVNTYCHRLYQKLGVHSRQELLDLIYAVGEERCAEERPGF